MLRHTLRRSQIRSQLSKSCRQYSILQISEEVRDAVQTGKPVVALESTIYTHGFPYPENAALASSLESVVRINGGIPATIAVMNGFAKVGLSQSELVELASMAGNKETMKVSRRDLGFITGLGISGRKLNGGTTVSGTMILAAKAGIDVFGTGGLGGVHRGGEDSMDISADLTELGRTPVCVVSSGCKSFLDIPRTLEYLETQGALVATFADSRPGDIDFPAFWTRDSGFKSPAVIQNEVEAASIIYAQKQLGVKSGILFANPIPIEHSIPQAEMDIAINAAIQEANEKGFSGNRNTPFILAKIKELTEGKSVPANRALVESNVAFATRVAVQLSKLRLEMARSDASAEGKLDRSSKTENNKGYSVYIPPSSEESQLSTKDKGLSLPVTHGIASSKESDIASLPLLVPDVVVFGSIAMDLACNYQPHDSSNLSPLPHTSNPSKFESTVGGVGNNVANAISKMIGSEGPKVQLRSFVGDDIFGNAILTELKNNGRSTSGIKVLPGSHTAQYVSINDAKKDLVIAMADMSILDVQEGTCGEFERKMSNSQPPNYVVVDANWPANIIAKCVKNAKAQRSTVIFEPVSTAKSASLFSWKHKGSKRIPSLGIYPNHTVDIVSPNEHELAAMYIAAKTAEFMESPDWFPVIDSFGIPNSGVQYQLGPWANKNLVTSGIPQQTIQLLPFIPTILTKLGPNGVLVTELLGPEDERLFARDEAQYIISRSIVDNPLVGGIYMRYYPGKDLDKEEVQSVNGAGDTFLGVVVAGLASGAKLDERLIDLAQRGAIETLKSKLAVSENLGLLQADLRKLVG